MWRNRATPGVEETTEPDAEVEAAAVGFCPACAGTPVSAVGA